MNSRTIKMLLVEDNAGDARLVREALAETPEFQCEVTHREIRVQALESLATNQPDVILSDLGLPDSPGLQIVREIHETAPQVPLVLLTGLDDESLAMQSLDEGAQDYLVKSEIDGVLLSHALSYAMKRQRVQLDRLALALIDDLTGLNNRRGFVALAEHHVKLACRTGKPFLLAFVEAADVLRDCFLQSDILRGLVEMNSPFSSLTQPKTASRPSLIVCNTNWILTTQDPAGATSFPSVLGLSLVRLNLPTLRNCCMTLTRSCTSKSVRDGFRVKSPSLMREALNT